MPPTLKNNSLLFLTRNLGDLKNGSIIKNLLEESSKHSTTQKNLFIYINPLSALSTFPQQPFIHSDKYLLRKIINEFYLNSSRLKLKFNLRCLLNNINNITTSHLLPDYKYDLILTDCQPDYFNDLKTFCSSHLPSSEFNFNKTSINSIVSLSQLTLNGHKGSLKEEENDEVNNNNEDYDKNDLLTIHKSDIFTNSIVAGTFDRLHIGHKMMLTETALLTRAKVLVGVTDECMLERKVLSELIEPWNVRAKNVEDFLNIVAPWLDVELVRIKDPFGPSIIEKDYQVIEPFFVLYN
jgi:hypothetical protein